ncbi:MAG: fibrobacter succinogenes major paralogous domain-containing protein [Bacteroidetes bacterium]|nr:fibrobacter succinogenes major paralogous domain-containing protein [Bacteroidota bacterium]
MKKEHFTATLSLLLLLVLVSCSQEETKTKNQLASRLGAPIATNTVQIGSQIWMTKNLNVSHYRNGDPIPQVTDPSQWANLTTGAWCYYQNNTANGRVYGKLYNWYAVNDPRGLAPSGYHIPTDTEYSELINSLGGTNVAGAALKESGTVHWNSPNSGASNSSGFTGLPGGTCQVNGSYYGLGILGCWWTATENNSCCAWYYTFAYNGNTVSKVNYGKNGGLSIRCIKDVAIDIDGNTYQPVTIGTQTWTQSNLKVSRYRNGDPIPQVQDPGAWENLTTGAWCYYDNDPNYNGQRYGKLYNWYAINDPRGIAPVGFHIPSDAEWSVLTTYLNGDGNAMKSVLWGGSFPVGCAPSNSSRFAGLPGGWRDDFFFVYYGINDACLWWSSTEHTNSGAWDRSIERISPAIYRSDRGKKSGLSVRCVQD